MDKIVFILLLTISFSFDAISQNDTINQVDENGLKTGYWIYYFDNGNIKSEGNYKIILINDLEELFMMGIYEPDTIGYTFVKEGLWKEYNSSGNIIIYEYWKNGKNIKNSIREFDINNHEIYNPDYSDYVINIDECFNFKSDNIINRIGKITCKTLILPDELSNDSTVNYEISSNRIRNIKIINEDSLQILKYNYLIEAGHHYDTIKILHIEINDINETFKIFSFGYNISCDDLKKDYQNMKSFTLKTDTLYYFRMNRACEMKIYKYGNHLNYNYLTSGKAIPLLTTPLSLNYNIINLSSFKKGKYLIRTIYYSHSKNKFAIIELK